MYRHTQWETEKGATGVNATRLHTCELALMWTHLVKSYTEYNFKIDSTDLNVTTCTGRVRSCHNTSISQLWNITTYEESGDFVNNFLYC